ncbi:MAG: YfiR family protein [Verrucomicrobia bacterium]|nr:YfiR family protein [Verrucomicrobiota bacterium]
MAVLALVTWPERVARRCRTLLVRALIFFGALHGFLEAAPTKEYQVKAVFLFNFAQFVDWPAESFAAPNSPVVIGVLGDDPFDGLLDDAVRGETAHGRPLAVQRFKRVSEIETCHVLFIGPKDSQHLAEILRDLQGRNILTVGESENFAKSGGIIRFMTDNGKIRLRINVDAAHDANLKLSSKLLRPAEIVHARRTES